MFTLRAAGFTPARNVIAPQCGARHQPCRVTLAPNKFSLEIVRVVQSGGRRVLGKCRSTDDNFLSITSNDSQQSANISIEVLDSSTAKVTIITADRPGLMRDVSGALSKLNLSIQNATITTSNQGVKDTFLVKIEEGSDGDFEDQNCFFDPDGFVCETMLAKVKKSIFEEAIASWGLGNSDEPKAPVEQKIIEPNVEVMRFNRAGSNSMMIRIEATDRPGILSSLTSALSKLGVSIVSADISTKYGCVYNKLIVNAPEDLKMEAIRVSALKSIQ